jgi:polyketide synthase 12/myxalamid-type polyketide synthase MxaB
MGGSNAHVVLEEARQPLKRCLLPTANGPAICWRSLPRRSAAALAALVQRYMTHLQGQSGLELGDLFQPQRRGVPILPTEWRLSQLRTKSSRKRWQPTAREPSDDRRRFGGEPEQQPRPKLAFLFTGQGFSGRRHGAGTLQRRSPSSAKTLDRCAELLAGQMEAPLLQVFRGSGQGAGDADAIDRPPKMHGRLSLPWSMRWPRSGFPGGKTGSVARPQCGRDRGGLRSPGSSAWRMG